MTPDHEAAKRHAEEVVKLEETVACLGNLSNLSAAYLDAMARHANATELLEKLLYHTIADESAEAIRAFLAAERE